MHVEVDLWLFFRKVHLNLLKYLFLEGYWINDKIQVNMISKIFQETEIESPRPFETELIKWNVHFLQGRIQSKQDVFLNVQHRIVSDLVIREVQIQDYRSCFQKLQQVAETIHT